MKPGSLEPATEAIQALSMRILRRVVCLTWAILLLAMLSVSLSVTASAMTVSPSPCNAGLRPDPAYDEASSPTFEYESVMGELPAEVRDQSGATSGILAYLPEATIARSAGIGMADGPNLYAYVRQNPWSAFDPDGLFLRWAMDKFDEHVANPFGDWVANSVSLETCNAVGNSKVCSAIEKTARVVHSTSKGALDALCPGSGVLDAGEKICMSEQPITLSQVGDLAKAAVDDFAGKKLKIAVAAGDATVCAVKGDGMGALQAVTEGAVEMLTKSKGGRKGKASTREQNADLADHYKDSSGGMHTAGAGLPEKGIRDPATGQIRFPDGEVTADGSKTYFNTYDTNAAGGMTTREADAAVDIIKNMPAGSIFHSVPKIE